MSILIAAVLASALGVGFGRADITPPSGMLMT